jgi:hypothetical protein
MAHGPIPDKPETAMIFALSRESNSLVIPEPPPVPDAIEHGEKFEGTSWAIKISDLDALLAFAERVGPIRVHAPSDLYEGRPHIVIADE